MITVRRAVWPSPGSIQQAAASTTDVYTYANNEWRGESVTPMAANVQWDVAVKSSNDPKTGRAYTPLVRMLYNEQEIAFRSECTPDCRWFHVVQAH